MYSIINIMSNKCTKLKTLKPIIIFYTLIKYKSYTLKIHLHINNIILKNFKFF